MRFGPCGGVRADLSCEVGPVRCPFGTLDDPVPWDGPEPPRRPEPALLAAPPVVLTDLTSPPFDRRGLAGVVATLAGTCDGLLVGEHHNRPDFPPTQMTALVRDAGGAPVITLTCRDRNRVVLDQELAGLAGLAAEGPAAVLCATGDARAAGVRPGVTQVFDLDGTALAAHAAAAGLAVGVPESPGAPPLRLRPGRLAQKQRAGAQFAVLNHVAGPARLAVFAGRARAAGATLPLVAGVAVYTDERSAKVLAAFPGLHLDADRVATVLTAPDPVEAGIAEAVEQARALLAVDGVVGVNLSGLASAKGPVEGAAVKAAVGRALKDAA